MAVEWYCQLMGSELGPYSSVQLVEMARCHRITPEDLIKKGKAGEWVPAYRVKGLFDSAARPSPALAAQAAVPGAGESDRPPGKHPDEAAARPATLLRRIDPAAGRDEWFCISAGKKLGPMSFESLRERAANGEIKATDRVWSSSTPKWSQAANIKGLSFSEP